MSTVLNVLGLRFANRIVEPLSATPMSGRSSSSSTRISGWRAGPASTTARARWSTWCRATCCRCSRCSRWEPPATLERRRPPRPEVAGAARDQVLAGRPGVVLPPRPVHRRHHRVAAAAGLPRRVRHPGRQQHRDPRRGRVHGRYLAVGRVPFLLRSGKALGRARKEVVVTFAPPPRCLTASPALTGQTGSASACAPTGCSWTSTSTVRRPEPARPGHAAGRLRRGRPGALR